MWSHLPNCVMVCSQGMSVHVSQGRKRWVHSYAWVPDFTARLFIGGLSGCLFSAGFHREEHWTPFISPTALYTIPGTVRSVQRKGRARQRERDKDLWSEAERRTLQMQKQEKQKAEIQSILKQRLQRPRRSRRYSPRNIMRCTVGGGGRCVCPCVLVNLCACACVCTKQTTQLCDFSLTRTSSSLCSHRDRASLQPLGCHPDVCEESHVFL